MIKNTLIFVVSGGMLAQIVPLKLFDPGWKVEVPSRVATVWNPPLPCLTCSWRVQLAPAGILPLFSTLADHATQVVEAQPADTSDMDSSH